MPEEHETTQRLDDDAADPTGTSWATDWQPEPAEDGDPDSPFHPLQTGYLVVGLLAIGLALMWLLTERGVMEVGDGGVAFSIVLIVSGLVALAASLGRSLRRR